MPSLTVDSRLSATKPLLAPATLIAGLPPSAEQLATVAASRDEIAAILRGEDDRLFVVVGPCSIHDPVAALDYANRLAPLARRLAPDLLIVMRVYF